MASFHERQTQQRRAGFLNRYRWLVVTATVIAIGAAIVLLAVYSGGGSAGGGGGGGY